MEHNTLWLKTLHQFRLACEGFDAVWRKRMRVFDTFNVILALLNLCGGDEKSYRSVMEHFSEELKRVPAASSFCAARRNFPAYLIGEIRSELLHLWDNETSAILFYGLQTYAVDGSWLNLPRQLIHENFKVESKGYYPCGLLSGMIRLSDRMIIDVSLTSSFDEREAAKPFLENLTHKDLVVYDRGYFSHLFMLEHVERGIGAVFRVSRGNNTKQINDAWEREENDFVIELHPGKSVCAKALQEFPEKLRTSITVRIIKYEIDNEEYMLITNVLDRTITAKAFQSLYWNRWTIEEFYKPCKQTIKIESFRSKSLNGVEQEIQAASLLWNFAMLMNKMIPDDLKKTA